MVRCDDVHISSVIHGTVELICVGPAGINICLFSSYVYILRFRHTRKITPIIFWVAVLMFCFATIHVSLGFCRLIWGFIDLRDMPGGPGAYFSDVSTPPNVAKVTIHSVNSILGDSIVVSDTLGCIVARFRVDVELDRRCGGAGMYGAGTGRFVSYPSC